MNEIIFDHKKTLQTLATLIQEEENCVAEIYLDPKFIEEKKNTLDIARKKNGEEFTVLIIGIFNSGKSSMINALIGEELLPHGFLPETAILGELHYGTKKQITLYPKKGMWDGGDAPFDIDPAEIEKYASLNADDSVNIREKDTDGNDSSRINSKFEKMVIHWPLEMLKDGVILVDSPGINDPYSNDYIVNDYLPKADAIVYVMSSTAAYTMTDKKQLLTINGLGRKNIVTGYTFYDEVERNTRRNPEKLQNLRQVLISHMLKHSDLGEESIHFLDSIKGLDARLDKNPELWRRSGFEGFEEYLAQYLVEGKGKDQVKNMISTILLQAESMKKDVERLNAAAKQDTVEIQARIADANQRLDITRNNAFQTARNFRNSLENELPKIESIVREFIMEKLPQLVDLDNYQPETTLPDGPARLWPFGESTTRRKAIAIRDECFEELERRMDLEYKKWANSTLNVYLKDAVTESNKKIAPQLENIAKDLTNITNMVSGYKPDEEGNLGNIAAGAAFAIITGDVVTGSMAVAYGPRAMLRAGAFQLGAGVGLGALALMGAPITVPVVVITALVASITSILTADNNDKVKRIKAQAVADFRESFNEVEGREALDITISGIMNNVKEYIDDACAELEADLNSDIEDTEKVIQQIIDTNNLSLAQKTKQIELRNEAVTKLEKLAEDALSIGKDYNVTNISSAVR